MDPIPQAHGEHSDVRSIDEPSRTLRSHAFTVPVADRVCCGGAEQLHDGVSGRRSEDRSESERA